MPPDAQTQPDTDATQPGSAPTQPEPAPEPPADAPGPDEGEPADPGAAGPATAPDEPANGSERPDQNAQGSPEPESTPSQADGAQASVEPARLQKIRSLYESGRFQEAFILVRRTQAKREPVSRTEAFRKLRLRVTQGQRKAQQLRQAVGSLGSDNPSRVVAGQRMLKRGGEPAQILLEQAVLQGPPEVAPPAADLLLEVAPGRGVEVTLQRFRQAESPRLIEGLVRRLLRHADQITPERLRELYGSLRPADALTSADGDPSAAEQPLAHTAGRLAVLGRVLSERFDMDTQALSEALSDPQAPRRLLSLTQRTLPRVRGGPLEALAEPIASLGGVVVEDFEDVSVGAGLEALRRWRAGKMLDEAKVDDKEFFGKGRGESKGRSLLLRASQAVDDAQEVMVMDLKGVVSRGIVTFEYKFWETTQNTDGNLWVRNEKGEHVIGAGTENPEWEVAVGSQEKVNDRQRGDQYQRWIHVILTVDTEQDRARVTFIETHEEMRQTYGWFDLPPTERLSTVGIGPSRWWRIDDLKIYPGMPKQDNPS